MIINSDLKALKALCKMESNFVNNHNKKYLLNKLINQEKQHKQVIVSIKGNSRIE